jgi:hypothetical membrane protein
LSRRKNTLLLSGGAGGVTAPVVAFTCILISIASYPAFSWTNNALSDLGIIPGITGPVFNFGLYCSGLLVLKFAAFGLFKYLGSWMGKIGAATFAATAVVLIGIGVAPENVVPYHYLFSLAFFTLLPISLFIITVAFAFKHQTKLALFTLLTAAATATPWILQFTIHYVQGVAIPEFASAVAGSVWAVLLGYKMLKAASQPKKT